MAFLDFDLNDEQYADEGGFDSLPAGWYMAKITQADLTKTKAGTGQYIKMRFDITGPTHEGRVVFANININNPNPTAEKIGRGQLRQMRDAMGMGELKDTDQLVGGDLQIKLSVINDEKYGDGNELKGFKPIGGGSTAPRPAAQASAPAGASASPPWAK
jgi:hypothetical protein